MGDLEETGRRRWLREIVGALAFRLASRACPPTGRPQKGDGMFRELLADIRYGLRMLVRSPGFTTVALVTMALGIGANTAMFSIVHGVVLKPLPYPNADRIVALRENNLSRGFTSFTIAPDDFWDWQKRNRSLDILAAYQGTSVTYTGGQRPESLAALRVSDGFLEILGGQPARGRGITKEDLDPSGEGVVVVSHGFWQRTFGGDPNVVGRLMILDGAAHTVVGVLPQNWRPLSRQSIDLVLPLRRQAWWSRGSHFLLGLGRLRPGVTLEQARSDFASIANALQAEYADTNTGWGTVVRRLDDVLLGSTRPQLLMFLAMVGLVLLIACANLANMTLARGVARMRELAVRAAIGAGRGRIVRQLLAESLLLATLAGALGLALGTAALRAFVAGWPTLLPRMQEIGLNAPVLLFCLGLSLVSGLLFGLAPALSVARSNLHQTLQYAGRGAVGSRSRRWMRTGLAVAELGLAASLLVGTGLLVRSFSALRAEDPGFRTENRLVFSTPLAEARYAARERIAAYEETTLARLGALPGVESAAVTSLLPIGGSDELQAFWHEEHAQPGAQEDGVALFYRVSPSYFETMGIPVLSGRGITREDREGGRPVVAISASFARRYFAGKDPVGSRIRFGRDADEPPMEIIGVVGDVQHYRLGETPEAQMYVPFHQRPTGDLSFVVKASIPPQGLVDGVRAVIKAADPDQPIVDLQTADAMIGESISMPRFRAILVTGFGLTALLLAAVGLYGVMACSVSQRTREIGVRMALGATPRSVLGLVLREGSVLVAIGLAIGLGAALSLSRILQSMLFGVDARDPMVFAAVPVILATVAVVAMLVPARRAIRVDPIRTLGQE
jgi:putative ABC transport system permease protein